MQMLSDYIAIQSSTIHTDVLWPTAGRQQHTDVEVDLFVNETMLSRSDINQWRW